MLVFISSPVSREQLESVLEHEEQVSSTREAASFGWVSVAFSFAVRVFAALCVSDIKKNKSKARCSVTRVLHPGLWHNLQSCFVLAGAYSHALVTKNHHRQLLERARLPGSSYSPACTRHALCRPEGNLFIRVCHKKRPVKRLKLRLFLSRYIWGLHIPSAKTFN